MAVRRSRFDTWWIVLLDPSLNLIGLSSNESSSDDESSSDGAKGERLDEAAATQPGDFLLAAIRVLWPEPDPFHSRRRTLFVDTKRLYRAPSIQRTST